MRDLLFHALLRISDVGLSHTPCLIIMLAIACSVLGLNVGATALKVPTRTSTLSMATPLESKFVYGRSSGPLSQNFAANMGDCAQIPVAADGSITYKPRIAKVTSNSEYSRFLNDAPKVLVRNTPAPKALSAADAVPVLQGATGKVVPTGKAGNAVKPLESNFVYERGQFTYNGRS